MEHRAATLDASIVTTSENSATSHEHRPDRDAALPETLLCLFHGRPHELVEHLAKLYARRVRHARMRAMTPSVLVVTDVQDKLFNAMDVERRDEVIKNIKILVRAARRLGVPIVVTEQYPRGLGRTLPELREAVGDVATLEKTSFSSCGADRFEARLTASGARHIVMTGLEAHVCVLLTSLDLLARGYAVSIVADAVCSRRPTSVDLGLAQARQSGAVVTSTETVVFQWLERADTDVFREVSKLLR